MNKKSAHCMQGLAKKINQIERKMNKKKTRINNKTERLIIDNESI